MTSSDDGEEVQFNVISTTESIEAIFNAPDLTSLKMSVSYSNNDSNYDWEEDIDDVFKQSNVKRADFNILGTKKNPIKNIRNTFMGGFLKLCRRNGKAEAVTYKNDEKKILSTESSPQTSTIRYVDKVGKLSQIRTILMKQQ